ncbi:MAG TPA: type II secretion system F family protein [Acidimicrobiia bacterium]
MRRIAAASCGVIIAGPVGGLAALAAMEALGRLSRRRIFPSPDVLEVAATLLVLVGAGLPLVSALESAAPRIPGVDEVVRRARRIGSAPALGSARGPLAPLLRKLADAAVSGSPPEPTIRGFIDAERRRRHAEAVARARRLPIRLMLPMTLLVLPGFVLMVYGPVLIEFVTSLLGPLWN